MELPEDSYSLLADIQSLMNASPATFLAAKLKIPALPASDSGLCHCLRELLFMNQI